VTLSTEKPVVTPKFRYPSADVRLQAADKQRKYLRRGSKTPKMLLMSAGFELFLFKNGILPTEEKVDAVTTPFSKNESTSGTNMVAISTQNALAMATAVDFLSDAKVEELRTRERGIRVLKEKVHDKSGFALSSMNEDGANKDRQKVQMMAKSFHPRRLSAMTALKKNLEKASISTTSDTRSGNYLP
jgi:hypothetical protein